MIQETSEQRLPTTKTSERRRVELTMRSFGSSFRRHGNVSSEHQSKSATRVHSQRLFVRDIARTRSSIGAATFLAVDHDLRFVEPFGRFRSLSRSKFEIPVAVTDTEDEHHLCQRQSSGENAARLRRTRRTSTPSNLSDVLAEPFAGTSIVHRTQTRRNANSNQVRCLPPRELCSFSLSSVHRPRVES